MFLRNSASALAVAAIGLATACDRSVEPAAAAPAAVARVAAPSKKSAQQVPPPKAVNGFDLRGALIPVDEIERGGPPRDGIPAIDQPKFLPPDKAEFLKPDDLVVSVTVGGEVRAYPLRVLVWHEIANDQIGTNSFSVTYCPLCGTCMVFDRRIGDRVLDWGVSGLLYKSDVLMYDRQTESLWSQLKMQAVAGELKGTKLRLLPSEHLTFAAWRKQNPNGRVLSTETGFNRRYHAMPYQGYEQREAIMFAVGQIRDELKNKDWVIGLLIGDRAYAVPVKRAGEGPVVISTDAGPITVTYETSTKRVMATDRTGRSVPYVKAYWFAWQAFYPETVVIPRD